MQRDSIKINGGESDVDIERGKLNFGYNSARLTGNPSSATPQSDHAVVRGLRAEEACRFGGAAFDAPLRDFLALGFFFVVALLSSNAL